MAAIIDRLVSPGRQAPQGRSPVGVAALVWVTAALALPSALAGLLVAAYVRHGSPTGRLVAAGLLPDLVCSYAFYVLGSAFGP